MRHAEARERHRVSHIYSYFSLGAVLEVGDEVSAVLRLFQPGENHLRARDVLLGVEQVVVERLLAPLHALVLVRGGVRETLRRAGDAPEQTAEVGALRVRRSIAEVDVSESAAKTKGKNTSRRRIENRSRVQGRAQTAVGSPPPRAGRKSISRRGFSRRGIGVGRARGAVGDRRAVCFCSRRDATYLLMAAASLGDVALRALGLEDLRACESRHPRWERRG